MPAIQQQRTNIKNAGGSTRKIIGKFNPLILGEVHTARKGVPRRGALLAPDVAQPQLGRATLDLGEVSPDQSTDAVTETKAAPPICGVAGSCSAVTGTGGGRPPPVTRCAEEQSFAPARHGEGAGRAIIIDFAVMSVVLIIALIPESARRIEWQTGPWGRPFDPSPPAQPGIFDGEVKQLQGRIVIGKAAACLDDLAQRSVQCLDCIGGVDHLANARRASNALQH